MWEYVSYKFMFKETRVIGGRFESLRDDLRGGEEEGWVVFEGKGVVGIFEVFPRLDLCVLCKFTLFLHFYVSIFTS